ncbi:MAG: FAD/NAD(P)-binding oxidoreductase [Propionibacteriales bacterium]|nr:FAD/NAD(P)-binding oxidoreductase [Propionibacteriales bacterium]
MRRLVVLGAGTAGTMVVNQLRPRLDSEEWSITVVDQDDQHHYQPGYLYVPFGRYERNEIVRNRHHFIPDGVDLVLAEVSRIDTEENQVILHGGRELPYDYLVIATGTTPRPGKTPGLVSSQWRRSIFDFYTLDGAEALAAALQVFEGGRVVVHVTEMPIKCPPAPLEFTFLLEAWLRKNGLRERTTLVFVTPLDGAFTQPTASRILGGLLADRGIDLVTDFLVERVDPERKTLISYDGREVPFGMLVTVPLNMGADFVARSGLGDELHYVPVDPHTFQSKAHPNIFALGDASNIPASKAGSVAHFSVNTFVGNFIELAAGLPMTGSFDGHTNCFVETGDDKALLIDFNYETEPLPGKYPLPVVGPLSLLKETHANHLGKLAFRQLYWNVLLPGRPLPLPVKLSLRGKEQPYPADELEPTP